MMRLVFAVLVPFAAGSTSLAATINVPGDQPTIQAALNAAAASGDTILVSSGTFFESNLDPMGKAVTVRGTGATIIDAGGSGRALICNSGEGADTIFDDLQFRNGSSLVNGGAVLIESASPTFCRCQMWSSSAASGSGGGVAIVGGTPTFIDCQIRENDAINGGGVFIDDGATPVFEDCQIWSNDSTGNGGGIHCRDGSAVTITGGSLQVNTTDGRGGGMYCATGGDADVFDCEFRSNVTDVNGAGVHLSAGCTVVLDQCYFARGDALTGSGAGVSVNAGTATITNSLFEEGESINGAALFCDGGILNAINCTIKDNVASGAGGALFAFNGAAVTLANTILWDNMPSEIWNSSAATASHCNIQGGVPAGVTDGGGNIDADPMFTTSFNIRLQPFSPCIDAGDNALVPPAAALEDYYGVPRFADDLGIPDTGAGTAPIVDIGATEVQDNSAVINLTSGSGHFTIGSAVGNADPGDVLQLVDFVHAGTSNRGVNIQKDLEFRSASGDPALCKIDCEFLDRAFLISTASTVSFDGIGFENGLVTDSENTGGAVRIDPAALGADVSFTDCTFDSCFADFPDDADSVTLGGAIFAGADLTLTRCTFTNCEAGPHNLNPSDDRGAGGAVAASGPVAVTIDECAFDGNGAGKFGLGGAVYVQGDAVLVVTDSVFSDNFSEGEGGAIGCFQSGVSLDRCVFEGNSAYGRGSGVWAQGESTGVDPISITNSLFHANASGPGAAAFIGVPAAPISMTNCTVVENTGVMILQTVPGMTHQYKFDHDLVDSVAGADGMALGPISFPAASIPALRRVLEGPVQVSIPKPPFTGLTSSFSIAFWLRRPSPGLGIESFFDIGDVQTATDDYLNIRFGGPGVIDLRMRADSSNDLITMIAPIPSDAEWHHVVLTYNGSFTSFYIDGTQYVDPDLDSLTGLLDSFAEVKIDMPAGDRLANLQFYDRALTGVDITTLMTFVPLADTAGVFALDATANLTNTIIYDNEVDGNQGRTAQYGTGGAGAIMFSHCNVEALNPLIIGVVGNISADPVFVDAPGGNYRLDAGSPSIDAGDSSALPGGLTQDLDGSPRYVNDWMTPDTGTGPPPAIDMGAYEYAPPPCPCPGDIDGDCDTDAFDFAIYAPNYGSSGHPPFTNGDLDGDGDVDVFDFAIFAPDFGCVASGF